ncbi:MAG TPA: hypothetical protein VFX98_13295 [Longimicrobiaceae bacterium]|nr:hypothetical protein [Longimicrobiaceae bacterium]
MSESHSQKRRRSPRRWIVPPGLSTDGEPFAGYRVLEEMKDGGLALLLWQALRDVELWAATEPERRAELFPAEAWERRAGAVAALPLDSGLRAPLRDLARVLDPGAGDLPEAELAEACLAVSRWASERSLPRTAMTFAQVAAIAASEAAAPCYTVGLLARRAADYRRAETWFRRCIGLARRARDWKFYGLGCVGLGNLFIQRGDYPTARSWLFKALRASRRHGLWNVKPMALHDLCCVAIIGGKVEEVLGYARAAFKAYGRHHPRVVALAHDVAFFWMLQGYFAQALPVFRAVLTQPLDRPHRLLAQSSLARAAAGVGDRFGFADAWAATWRMVDEGDDSEKMAEALINLAQGAATLGDVDRAQMAASQALAVAIKRAEAEQRVVAEALLDSTRTLKQRTGAAAPSAPAPAPVPEGASALAADFVEVLSGGMAQA